MKKNLLLIFTFILLFAGCASTGTNKVENKLAKNSKNYPITNNLLNDIKQNSTKYNGKKLAFQGKIVKKIKGYKNKPYLKIEVSTNQNKNYLWVGALFDDNGYLKVGNTIRVLGFISKVEDDDKLAKKYNENNFHLLGYCFLNMNKMKAFSFVGTLKQCNAWRDGFIY